MGSYGIGPARILAAAIEQRADERGIVWPKALAPWGVHLVSLAKAGEPEREAADKLYEELREAGIEVLYDEREAGAGEKLTDAELLGCPLRIVVGRRGLANGIVEASERGSGAEHELPVEEAATRALSHPPGHRCLAALPSAAAACAASSASTAAAPNRSGPARASRSIPGPSPTPSATSAWRRCRSSSVLAYSSDDGTSFAAAMVFWAIAAGDYLDGLLARVTGQYSRMGALLDPLVDRLTILSGAVVCWSFELLPRWLLVVLALRELAMLTLAQYGLRHGVDIEVNWPGRISVFPIMGGIWLALFAPGWVADGAGDLGHGDGDPRHRHVRAGRQARGARSGPQAEAPKQANLQPSVEPLVALDL